MHGAGHPKPMIWNNSEGWRGERGGRRVQDGGTQAPVADSCPCLAKIITTL